MIIFIVGDLSKPKDGSCVWSHCWGDEYLIIPAILSCEQRGAIISIPVLGVNPTNPKDPATTKVGVLDVCPIIGLGNNNQTKKVVTLPTEKVDIK